MQWHIERIPQDEQGQAFCLDEYRSFRLAALRVDPASFGSTLARELAFDDSVWLSRLLNPLNAFFVALRDDDPPDGRREVLSSMVIRGPLPPPEDDDDDEDCLLFTINGIWTLPEARRQGIALALSKTAAERALAETLARGRAQCVVTVEAYESNPAAVAFYQKAGFSACGMAGAGIVRLQQRLSASAAAKT